MADDRYPSLAQRFQSHNASGRSQGGTPSPPPRSPAYSNGYQNYSNGNYAPVAQNLTTKFQQATSMPFTNNGYTNVGPTILTDGTVDDSKSEYHRTADERYARSRELLKQGQHALSIMQVQASRNGTVINPPTGPEKPRSAGSAYNRKDGPPMEQMVIEEAIDDEAKKQMWSTLDMTNVGIRCFAPELFAYTFLTQLHISNNHLTELSPAIGRLRLLTHLDASHNQLSSLPSELSMLTSLRELVLFDNKISAIPAEFGMLYQLEFLGIDGNPVNDTIRTLLDTDGTIGFIHYLRDSCPVPLPPPEREWAEIPDGKQEGESFSVFCYNILADKYASASMYGYTPSWALAWEYRRELILHEITSYAADIICLQEIDKENFNKYFAPALHAKGYQSFFWQKSRVRTMNESEQKSVDGCATFYRSSMFEAVNQQYMEFNQAPSFKRDPKYQYTKEVYNRFMTKDQIAIFTMLESKTSGAKLMVANVHLFWDHRFRDVKVLQTAMMMDEIHNLANGFAKNPAKCVPKDKAPKYNSGVDIPLIICGDFNSLPNSGVYEFLSQGSIEENHADFMGYDYGNYVKDGRTHEFPLKSAYSRIGELPFTNHTPGFKGVIDYIWNTANSLEVIGLLKDVEKSYIEGVVGFPNAHFPSDHICIMAEFRVITSQLTRTQVFH